MIKWLHNKYMEQNKIDTTHAKNIAFLKEYLKERDYDWLNHNLGIDVSYFSSGGGTHLYLIKNGDRKLLARINFFLGKNDWKVKRIEFEILKEIEPLNISPKAYLLDENNELEQDFTIVDYIEGNNITEFLDSDIILIAHDLKKLHNFPKEYVKEEELPYKCSIYDEFTGGDDKKIENYKYQDIEQVFDKYNEIKNDLGEWFNGLTIFDGCDNLCLCHADLKSENILKISNGIMLIDWECAGVDIPETDIGRLFSGCVLNEKQQGIFLKEYYGDTSSKDILNRILAVEIVLDFFRILEDYCIHQRKEFNAEAMINDLDEYQKNLELLKIKLNN